MKITFEIFNKYKYFSQNFVIGSKFLMKYFVDIGI